MPSNGLQGARSTGAFLDEAQTFFEVLLTDGVSPRKAYEAANRLLPEGVDLRAIHEQENPS